MWWIVKIQIYYLSGFILAIFVSLRWLLIHLNLSDTQY